MADQKSTPEESLAALKALNDEMGKRTISDKALRGWQERYDRIVLACREIERDWAANPPRRIREELAPFEERWATQMAEFQIVYEQIENAAKSGADWVVVNTFLADALEAPARQLLSFLDLPCRLKTSRVVGPARPERFSEFAPSVRRAILGAAARPDPEKPVEEKPR